LEIGLHVEAQDFWRAMARRRQETAPQKETLG
jgi:hypothetical protein